MIERTVWKNSVKENNEDIRTLLKIVTNRHLCNNLEYRLEDIFYKYREGIYLEKFYIDSLILREKDMEITSYLRLLEKIYRICEKYEISLFPHFFWELAVDMGIKNIHIPFYKATDVDRDKFFNIGISVHSVDEAKISQNLGASYVNFGHIFETDCKRGIKPRGVKLLGEVVKYVDIPVFAIGGIGYKNYEYVLEFGASGVCMMSEIMRGE